MKQKEADGRLMMEWWLKKFHNTTIEEVMEKHPTATTSPEWFKYYKVTKEQEQEWTDWCKNYLRKECKMSKAYIDRGWGMLSLNIGPSVIYDDDETIQK